MRSCHPQTHTAFQHFMNKAGGPDDEASIYTHVHRDETESELTSFVYIAHLRYACHHVFFMPCVDQNLVFSLSSAVYAHAGVTVVLHLLDCLTWHGS